jgi:hypothetical protein
MKPRAHVFERRTGSRACPIEEHRLAGTSVPSNKGIAWVHIAMDYAGGQRCSPRELAPDPAMSARHARHSRERVRERRKLRVGATAIECGSCPDRKLAKLRIVVPVADELRRFPG